MGNSGRQYQIAGEIIIAERIVGYSMQILRQMQFALEMTPGKCVITNICNAIVKGKRYCDNFQAFAKKN